MTLEQRVIAGFTLTTGVRAIQQLVLVAVSVQLARLLSPEHFGIVAIALAATGFLAMLAEFGLGGALVQQRRLQDEHLQSVFWIAVAAGGALAGAGYAGAPLLASFMGESSLTPVVRVLSCSLLIAGMGIVPRAVLQRDMAFARLAQVEGGAVLASGAVALLLAFNGAGVWSIVAQTLVLTTWNAAGFTMLARWRPRLAFSRAAVRDVLGVGSGIAGFNVVNFGARHFDDLIVGRVLGTHALGLYGRAYMLMLLPVSQLSVATGAVLLPALSALRGRPEEARHLYLRVLQLGGLLTLPVLLGAFAVADSLVPVLFGPGWIDMVPVFRILCLAGCVQVALTPAGWIYQAMGATRALFSWGVVASGVTIAAFLLGAALGSIEAVAACYLAGTLLLVYPGLRLAGGLIGLPARATAQALSRPFAAAAAMLVVVWSTGLLIEARLGPAAQLATEVVAGALAYAAFVGMLCPAPVRELWAGRRSRTASPLRDAVSPQISHAPAAEARVEVG